jgi:hypothetical protein
MTTFSRNAKLQYRAFLLMLATPVWCARGALPGDGRGAGQRGIQGASRI